MNHKFEELTDPSRITNNMFKIAFNDDFVFNTWLPALRSNTYSQGTGALRKQTYDNGDSFCCLGVGCNIMDSSKWRFEANVKRWWFNTECGISPEFAEFAGLKGDNGPFYFIEESDEPGVTDSCLSALNDGGYTFAQIADIIEVHAKEAMKRRGRS